MVLPALKPQLFLADIQGAPSTSRRLPFSIDTVSPTNLVQLKAWKAPEKREHLGF